MIFEQSSFDPLEANKIFIKTHFIFFSSRIKLIIKKFILLIISIFLTGQVNNAQQKIALESLIPLAPNAAELSKYGSYPVGMSTGIPDISFPIYTINAGLLHLPITISYHASGIKVNQKASDIGLGWVLNAGGAISRTVYGVADDKQYGVFNSIPRTLTDLNSLMSYDSLRKYAGQAWYDEEPDIFYYNMGAKSGKFIFGRDREFSTIPFEPIKINMVSQGSGTKKFLLTDENGTRYYFNEEVYSISDPDYSLRKTASTWYLSEIISFDGSDTINIAYELNTVEDQVEEHSWLFGQEKSADGFTYGPDDGQATKNVTAINNTELLIKTITFRNGRIEFNRNSIRKDLFLTSRALDEIVIFNSNEDVIKKFEFNYDYFNSEPFYNNWQSYRLKLIGFSEVGNKNLNSSSYKFEYDETKLPPSNSYNVDYWGYANESSNQSLVPRQTIKAMELGPVTFADGTSLSFGAFDPINSWVVGNANRETSLSKIKAATLKKIIYPTGGYTLFDFEPHRFISEEYKKQSVTKGGKVIGMDKYTKSETQYSFGFPSSTAPSYLNGMEVGNISIFFSPSNINNSIVGETQLVTLTDLTDNKTQSWKHEGDITLSNTIFAKYLLNGQHSYLLTVSVYGDANITAEANIVWEQKLEEFEIKNGGGLRVNSIKHYTADNLMASEESFKYGIKENGFGKKLFSDWLFYKAYQNNALEYWISGFNPGSGLCTPDNHGPYLQRHYIGLSSHSSLTYLGTPIVYETVTKYFGSSSNNTGKKIYYYRIQDESPSIPMEFLAPSNYGSINNAWSLAELIADSTFKLVNGMYLPVSANNYDYQEFNVKEDTGILIRQHTSIISSDCSMPTLVGGINCPETPGIGYFSIKNYSIKTGSSKLVKTTATTFDQVTGTKKIITTEQKEYSNNKHLFPTSIIFSRSDDRMEVKHFKYPQDNFDDISNLMTSKNILSPVLEEVRSVKLLNGDEYQQEKKKNEYGLVGDAIRLKFVHYSTNSNPSEPRVLNNKFDERGNILEQQLSNNSKHAFIWGMQKMYPVAEVLNSGPDEILFEGFEEGNGSSNLNLVVDNAVFKTGRNAGRIDNQNLTTISAQLNNSVKPNESQMMKISGWVYTDSGVGEVTILKKSSLDNSLSYLSHISNAINGKWTYLTKIISVPSDVSDIIVRLDNKGGGPVWFDEIRIAPANAVMTTYNYTPLVGLNSKTDPNNKTEYYYYDDLGRLNFIKDESGNIIKSFCYNYHGQVENCNLVCQKPANWQPITSYVCEKDASGNNTGYQSRTLKDMEPCSSSYNTTKIEKVYNSTACTLPYTCSTSNCSGTDKKCINNICETGCKVYTSSVYTKINNPAGDPPQIWVWRCTYHYQWSDGSVSPNYTEDNTTSCPLGNPCIGEM